MSAYEYMNVALDHFQFAGLLALGFALITAIYLVAMWQVAGRLGSARNFVLQTLFLGWQSNVAFLAVVTLRSGRASIAAAGGDAALGWQAAPWLVPGAATLYSSVLVLCVVFAVQCGRANSAGAGA